MRTFFIIFIKELRAFFFSPLAWTVMALFTFLNGWLFASMVNAMQMRVSSRSLVYNFFDSGWFWMGFFILFPLITMRLFAEEKKMGTIEGLLTAPVRTTDVLLGKYFAALVGFLVIVTPMYLFFFLFQAITGEEAAFQGGALWGVGLGIVIVGIFNVALGTLASALTANQLIAAMLTYVFAMLHYFLGFLHKFGVVPGSAWTGGMTYFSTTEHMHALSGGLIDSGPIIYYVSFSVLLLAIAYHVLESRKWRV
jgi:ABC-2 type transport system permease protein|tara:strand:- start:3707 stop:4462 length:756 start_codon:yes stop_codon:yes gene_type:complete